VSCVDDLATSEKDVKPRHDIWQLRLHSTHEIPAHGGAHLRYS